MGKNNLKKTWDSISPDKETKEKMFNNILENADRQLVAQPRKRTPKQIVGIILPYAGVAIAIVMVAIIVLPMLTKNQNIVDRNVSKILNTSQTTKSTLSNENSNNISEDNLSKKAETKKEKDKTKKATTTTIYVEKEVSDKTEKEIAYMKKWHEKSINEKFAEIKYKHTHYSVTGKTDGNLVKEKLATSTAYGYDVYENKNYDTKVTIYKIEKIDENAVVAIKYDGHEGYYSAVNSLYEFKTLGDLVEKINLRQHLVFNKIHYDYEEKTSFGKMRYNAKYTLEDMSAIWDLLFDDLSLKNVYEDSRHADEVMGISVDVSVIGASNISVSVDKDGYLNTNIMHTGKSFFIGKQKVEDFKNYVLKNKNSEAVYRTPIMDVPDEREIVDDESDSKAIITITSQGHNPNK